MQRDVPEATSAAAPRGWAEAQLDAEEPVLRMIGSDRPAGEVLSALCRMIEALCPGAIAAVRRLDPDGRHLRWASAERLPALYREATEAEPVGPGRGACGTAVATGEAVISPDIARDPHWERCRRPALEAGLRAAWSVPILATAGGVLGTLVTFFGGPRQAAESELRLCRRAARLAGIALERHRVEEALRLREERFRQLADALPQIVWVTRPDGSVDFYNRRWFDYTGLTPEQSYRPEGWRSAVHPEDLAPLMAASVRSHATHEPFESVYRLRARDGTYRWHLGRAVPVCDEAGHEVARFGTATDIDDRKRSEQDARFLAEAGASLATLDDEAATLRQVARLAVPFFADWCVVDMADAEGTLRRLAVAHMDPSKVEYALEVDRRYPSHPDTPRGVYHVLRTGESVLVPEITDAMLEAGVPDPEHLRILRALGLRSSMSVPLRGRPGVLGVMTFVAAESGRRYGEADLRLAEDLAHRAATAVENARLYDRLREADRRKDDFLATLAHELRNPLAPIRNALHLMAHPDPEGRGHESERAMAERQVGHLARLVDDLMDVARISRGKVALRRQVVELAPIVRHAIEAVRPSAAARGQILDVALPGGPIRLDADPTRLEQILDNLLSNAVKYTGPGGRIALGAEQAGDEVVVRVRDTGRGIPTEMLPKVFEMFVQVAPPGHSQGGLGIGLGLVRMLVAMHGGAISAHSAGPGTGTEFVVRLPALADPTAAPEEPSPSGPVRAEPRTGSGVPRRRVLVVDDNADAAESLARLLTRLYGQDVRVAHDGASALSLAGRFRPEVVLLDLGMPGLDGYEVARLLRASPEAGDALIVALTGWGQEADRRRSREAGFDRHLVKPVDLAALRDLLDRRD